MGNQIVVVILGGTNHKLELCKMDNAVIIED